MNKSVEPPQSLTEEPFEMRYALTQQEFIRGHRLHLRRNLFNGRNILLITAALAIAGLQAQVLGPAAWIVRIFVALWLGVLALMLAAYLLLPARLFSRLGPEGLVQRFRLTREGIQGGPEGHPMNPIPWTDLKAFLEDSELLLFQPRHGLPIVLPRRALEGIGGFAAFVTRMHGLRDGTV